VFACSSRDNKGWVVDFGGLKELKTKLQDHFDHTMVVAQDDPKLNMFHTLDEVGIIDLRVMPEVGCEAFAYKGWQLAAQVLGYTYPDGRVWVESCEVAEHGANSAIYTVEQVL
jgi:6-pyruvoyltetrahydropterin/6-carboxytetrahydropterin synthase